MHGQIDIDCDACIIDYDSQYYVLVLVLLLASIASSSSSSSIMHGGKIMWLYNVICTVCYIVYYSSYSVL